MKPVDSKGATKTQSHHCGLKFYQIVKIFSFFLRISTKKFHSIKILKFGKFVIFFHTVPKCFPKKLQIIWRDFLGNDSQSAFYYHPFQPWPFCLFPQCVLPYKQINELFLSSGVAAAAAEGTAVGLLTQKHEKSIGLLVNWEWR